MVALVKEDKKAQALEPKLSLPTLVGKEAADDQKKEARVALPRDGQLLRPETLEVPADIGEQDTHEAIFTLPAEKDEQCPKKYTHYQIKLLIFSEWLTDAKAQLGTTQSCISKGTEEIVRFLQTLRDDHTPGLQKEFGELSKQLDSVRVGLSDVLDDFCQFSSGYSFRRDDKVLRGDQNGAELDNAELDEAHLTTLSSLKGVSSDVKHLQEAIYLSMPYVERMKQHYEDDLAVFTDKGFPRLQEKDEEYLSRVTAVYNNLKQVMISLADFARSVESKPSLIHF